MTLTSSGRFTQMAGAVISDQDPAGGVAVTAQSLELGGAVAAAGAPVTLTAQSGAISQVGGGGYIQAGSLAGSAAGAATFGDEAANQVARLGGLQQRGRVPAARRHRARGVRARSPGRRWTSRRPAS